MNPNWNEDRYREWSRREYNSAENRSSWLPNHEYLKQHSDKFCTSCRENFYGKKICRYIFYSLVKVVHPDHVAYNIY